MTDAASYLKNLNQKIWKSHWFDQMCGRHSRRVKGTTLVRPMTSWEWRKVKTFVRHEGFGAVMGTSNFGFALGLTVVRAPMYPGLSHETLLSLSRDHLPYDCEHKQDWDFVWSKFSVLTHTDRNLEILRFCGIKMPLDKGHYKY